MTAKSFLDFKKNRNSLNDKLMAAVSEIGTTKKSFEKDERYWTFPVDKFGNGRVILRFLPSQFDEDTIVRYIDHSYKGPGGWYINKSLTTFNTETETHPDPMAEYNNYLWKVRRNGTEAEANAAEKIYNGNQKEPGTRPATRFVANILIVQDFKKTDSNNGKVFLYKFGTEIFTKIQEAIKPKFEGVEPVKPFDLWEGRNFDLRALSSKGKRTYSSSEWGEKGPVAATEEGIEQIFKQTHSVKEEISADKFKTYDELKKRLDIARGEVVVASPVAPTKREESSPFKETDEPSFLSTPPWVAEEDDKELSEFQDLLNK